MFLGNPGSPSRKREDPMASPRASPGKSRPPLTKNNFGRRTSDSPQRGVNRHVSMPTRGDLRRASVSDDDEEEIIEEYYDDEEIIEEEIIEEEIIEEEIVEEVEAKSFQGKRDVLDFLKASESKWKKFSAKEEEENGGGEEKKDASGKSYKKDVANFLADTGSKWALVANKIGIISDMDPNWVGSDDEEEIIEDEEEIEEIEIVEDEPATLPTKPSATASHNHDQHHHHASKEVPSTPSKDEEDDDDEEDEDEPDSQEVAEAIEYVLMVEKVVEKGIMTREQCDGMKEMPLVIMKEVLKHLENCDNSGKPIQWDLLKAIYNKEHGIEEEKEEEAAPAGGFRLVIS